MKDITPHALDAVQLLSDTLLIWSLDLGDKTRNIDLYFQYEHALNIQDCLRTPLISTDKRGFAR